VKIFVDTNVLAAASIAAHPHHAQAFDVVEKVKEGEWKGCVGLHSWVEYFAVMTRTPFVPRVHPADAWRYLDENIRPCFELLSPSVDDYDAALRQCTSMGLTGGIVHDSLQLQCARSAGCDRLYTFSLRNLRLIAPAEWQDRIVAP